MKNVSIKIGMLVALFATGFTSCEKAKQATEDFRVKLTDAPGDYDEVNVEIKAVFAHYSNMDGSSNWIKLETNTGIYDLLTLQNGVTADIAYQKNMPQGTVNQIKVELGDDNYIVKDGKRVELNYKSPTSKEILVKLDSEVDAKSGTEIIIDFDAEKSIEVGLDGKANLSPNIVLKSMVQIAL